MADGARRSLDLCVAVMALVVLLPLWLLIAALVRITSPGPVLYIAPRVGKDGVPFHMYKFRSMYVGSDTRQPGVTAADDPRITRVGRMLRATKLDEIPQLLNVIRGEMSLVGPRPEAPEYVSQYDSRQRHVLSVRPGVTGPTQLVFRDEERLLRYEDADRVYRSTLLPQKLEMDLRYLEHRTVLSDLRVLMSTVGKVVHR